MLAPSSKYSQITCRDKLNVPGLPTVFPATNDVFSPKSHRDADMCGEQWAAPVQNQEALKHVARFRQRVRQHTGVDAATLLSYIQFFVA